MVFGIGALSPGALKGLESLSLRTEGVFTQGKKGRVTPRTPRLGFSLSESFFLSSLSTAPVGLMGCALCHKEWVVSYS